MLPNVSPTHFRRSVAKPHRVAYSIRDRRHKPNERHRSALSPFYARPLLVRYRVTLQGRPRDVDVHITPGGSVSVTLDGKPFDADIRAIPGGVTLHIDGRVYDVMLGGPSDAMTLATEAHRATASVESERTRSKRSRRAEADAGKEIVAPMPGNVVKILVAPGDEVKAGQGVIVVEAMKMENELRAPADAVVKSVDVSEGDAVAGNAVLVTFE